MSCIVKKTPDEQGIYLFESQSHREYPENWNGEGWMPIPPALEDKCKKLIPWCKPIIRNGAVIDVQAVEHDEPDTMVAPVEQLRADVDFIAAMTGVDLV